MFALGLQVKDHITGFTGFVTGRVEYLTGCAQYLVQPECEDNKWCEARWFDENRLKALRGSKHIPKTKDVGPDAPAPMK